MEEMKLKSWYKANHQLYDDFCLRIRELIEEIIHEKNIPYQSITHRTKSWESFKNKCNGKYANFKNPIGHLTDMAGIRIIAYIKSDVDNISKIIENEFKIDPENSIDKADQMSENQVGYLSKHYIVKLNTRRASLPEYTRFRDLYCEIQVRTLLQHAWAEIEHDRNYKFSGILPQKKEIRRKFYLLAGTLELIDNEFQNLSDAIDKYSEEVKDATEKGNLYIPIDSTSLYEYMSQRFNRNWIKKSFENHDKVIISELNKFGITKLKDIDNIYPTDYIKRHEQLGVNKENFLGILRDFMIIKDYELYFSKCKETDWNSINQFSYNLFKSYGVPVDEILHEFGIIIVDDFDELG